LAAAAIGEAIALAPIASADTNPLVPYGNKTWSPHWIWCVTCPAAPCSVRMPGPAADANPVVAAS
jgi:hypothetical protein